MENLIIYSETKLLVKLDEILQAHYDIFKRAQKIIVGSLESA